MSNANTRYIDITPSTRLGYSYMQDKYYVTNKGSTTYRSTIEEIQNVLYSLDITDIEDSTIQGFKDTMEEITDLYYTISDIGSYISSMQFNDFSDYPLVMNCDKAKLYIKNSPIIFDLETKESPKIVRVPRLCSFYKETLGLHISADDMLTLYELLYSYYKPTCYMQIVKREDKADPLYYSDTLALSNYSNTANVVYNWKYNPLNTTNPLDIADIIETNIDTNTITLKNPINPDIIEKYSIHEGSKILINNLNTTVGETSYTGDGTYTITTIEDTKITVEETLPLDYVFPFYTVSYPLASYTVTTADRDSNSFTLSTSPDEILIGNTICIIGTTITTEYESITCDGTYTVNNIEGNTVYVNEEVPTNFEGNATLYKLMFISNVEYIEDNTIFLTNNPEITLKNHDVIVYNNSINKVYRVIEQDENSITLQENIENYTPLFATMQYPVPSSEVLVNITYVKEEYEEKLPISEFILDTPKQARSYIGRYHFAIQPSEEIIYKAWTEYEGDYPVSLHFTGDIVMKFLGVYTEIFTNEES